MSSPHRKRVTGHLKLRRLAPAHVGGGKPPTGHLTRRQAEDALADLLADERRKVGRRAYDHHPDGRPSPTPPRGSCATSSTSRDVSSRPPGTTG